MALIANHDQVITSAIRGFSGGELVSLLQFRPSVALLGLLYHRLSTVDDPYINLRKCVLLAIGSPRCRPWRLLCPLTRADLLVNCAPQTQKRAAP